MKKETIKKSIQILKNKESIDEIINELLVGGNKDEKGYRYLNDITIKTHEVGNRTRYSEIPIDANGRVTLNKPLSDNNREILKYLVHSFHHSVLQLFIAQAEEIQKEFDNLKDE